MSKRDLRLGRWRGPTIHDSVSETLGDALEAVGAAVVPGESRPRTLKFAVPIYGGRRDVDPRETAYRLRRQLRALLENPDARIGLYLEFDPDPELNGWVSLSGGDLVYEGDGGAGPTIGEFRLDLESVYRVGSRSRQREARRAEFVNRLLATTPRDTYLTVYDDAFTVVPGPSNLDPRPLIVLPVGARRVTGARGPTAVGAGVRTIDGTVSLVTGNALNDLLEGEVISYDRDERDYRLSDVVIHDAHGNDFPAADVVETWPNLTRWTAPADVAVDATGLRSTANHAALKTLVHHDARYNDGLYAGMQFKSGAAVAAFRAGFKFTHEDSGQTIRVALKASAGADSPALLEVIVTNSDGTINTSWTQSLFLSTNTRYYLGVRIVAERIIASAAQLPHAGSTAARIDATMDLAATDFGINAAVAASALERSRDETYSNVALEFTADDAGARIERVQSHAIRHAEDAYGWEEVYGQAQREPFPEVDAPVISNGLCRCRWLPTGSGNCLVVDMYREGLGYVEQGRVNAAGIEVGTNYALFLDSVEVLEWSPERAIVRYNVDNGDVYADLILTLERGDSGPRLELYTRRQSDYPVPGGQLRWTPATTGNLRAATIVEGGSTGTGTIVDTTLGTSWTGTLQTLVDDWYPALLLEAPSSAPDDTALASLALIATRAGAATFRAITNADTNGESPYGAARRGLALRDEEAGAGAGYIGLDVREVAKAQAFEAELMRNAASATTAQIGDAAASGGQTVRDTQAAATNPTLSWNVPNHYGEAVVYVRVRGEGGNGLTYRVDKVRGGVTTAGIASGVVVSNNYVARLGEIHNLQAGDTLRVYVWRSSGVGNVFIDRTVIVPLRRRPETGPWPDYLSALGDLVERAFSGTDSVPDLVDR